MKNIGAKSSVWLKAVGIETLDDLRAVGPVEAFVRVRDAGLSDHINLLWALAGALHDCHWAKLPEGERAALLMALEARKDAP